ncbi:MAG TPA: adenylyltransferase/cytidyltransferase family protein [Candidatus Bathyarchaeia archaeon]|nr:adenylyltransferase/cytidyltransferase family protein [Candidatus Bathyarchaeia archaeon]
MANEQVRKKHTTVLASGVFDLLHLGHVRFLEEAKKNGGKDAQLIVIVARDSTVKKRKGMKPIMSEDQRRALVESLKVVDEAILGYENFNMDQVIDKIKPDIIAMGYDQKDMAQTVEKAVTRKGLSIKIIKIDKFGEDELNSSSEIKRKIIEEYAEHG